MTPGAPRIVVVGAGVGGLVAGLELVAQGADVLLLEAAAAPGGKLRQVAPGGVPMDAGPTVFTMRWVFEELFQRIGARLDEELTLTPLHTLARHAWNDGETFDLHADLARSMDAMAAFSSPAEARRYGEFCQRAQRISQTLEAPFLRASRPNPLTLAGRVGLRGLPDLCRISPFATLWGALGRHFHDPRLRQLFGRYATYCGSSPFQAPATLMLVAHVEREGVWSVHGGMQRIAQTLAALATRRGARLRCAAPVERILTEGGRVSGVALASGEQIAADAVVFNGDVAALAQGLLGDGVQRAVPATPIARRSLSAITWNLHGRAQGFDLLRHTVFFSGDSRAEFDDLFAHERLPQDPTVYVCAQDRGDPGAAAPEGPERLLCLVNAPARADARPLTEPEIERCEQRSFERLTACGLHLARSPAQRTTPADFRRLFPATGGALYGQASHGWRASFSRPGSRCKVPGLYLAGGSTHPGPGVPMAALSGSLAAHGLLDDLATRRVSTRPWPTAATPGGTSTR